MNEQVGSLLGLKLKVHPKRMRFVGLPFHVFGKVLS